MVHLPQQNPADCPNCGSPREWRERRTREGGFRYIARCQHCHRQSLAKSRAKHGGAANRNRLWESKNRAAALAHRKVESHLKSGNIRRKPCERCGAENSQAHHDDYAFALEVTWLCPMHHAERHRELASVQPQSSQAETEAPGGMVPHPPAFPPGAHSNPDARTDSMTPSQSRRENARYESASERGRAHLEMENGNTVLNHQTPPASASEVAI